jgi:hypothetical protein
MDANWGEARMITVRLRERPEGWTVRVIYNGSRTEARLDRTYVSAADGLEAAARMLRELEQAQARQG